MTKKLADKIVEWLIRKNIVDMQDIELYVFAIQSLLLFAMPFIYAIIVGAIFNDIFSCITFVFPFVLIRKFSGGYHTKKEWTCSLLSICILTLYMVIERYIQNSIVLIGITLAASICLSYNSPIDNVNKVLTDNEKKLFGKIVFRLIVLLWFVILVCCMLGQQKCVSGISAGIVLTAILQIPCIITNLVKKKTKHVEKVSSHVKTLEK